MRKSTDAMSTPFERSSPDCLRLDKWLWAARFYKTRSLATAAIQGGHVRLNGQPIKPAHEIKTGDTLDITIGHTRWTVLVRKLTDARRPASEAQQLYEETADSIARRMHEKEMLRMAPVPGSHQGERPTKKARRQIHRFSEGH